MQANPQKNFAYYQTTQFHFSPNTYVTCSHKVRDKLQGNIFYTCQKAMGNKRILWVLDPHKGRTPEYGSNSGYNVEMKLCNLSLIL